MPLGVSPILASESPRRAVHSSSCSQCISQSIRLHFIPRDGIQSLGVDHELNGYHHYFDAVLGRSQEDFRVRCGRELAMCRASRRLANTSSWHFCVMFLCLLVSLDGPLELKNQSVVAQFLESDITTKTSPFDDPVCVMTMLSTLLP